MEYTHAGYNYKNSLNQERRLHAECTLEYFLTMQYIRI